MAKRKGLVSVPSGERARRAAAAAAGLPSGWVPVDSSWLAAVRYDVRGQELRVRFLDGAECVYRDVPQDLARGLFGAPSKGTYFHASGLYGWPYTQA